MLYHRRRIEWKMKITIYDAPRWFYHPLVCKSFSWRFNLLRNAERGQIRKTTPRRRANNSTCYTAPSKTRQKTSVLIERPRGHAKSIIHYTYTIAYQSLQYGTVVYSSGSNPLRLLSAICSSPGTRRTKNVKPHLIDLRVTRRRIRLNHPFILFYSYHFFFIQRNV